MRDGLGPFRAAHPLPLPGGSAMHDTNRPRLPALLALVTCVTILFGTATGFSQPEQEPATTVTAALEETSHDTVKAPQRLQVAQLVLAHGYDPIARAPVDSASAFVAEVGKVYCFTRIIGAPGATQITHAWYHEGETKAKVKLAVGSANWRTYSYKTILPSWTGRWEVKILDASGAVLATRSFTVN